MAKISKAEGPTDVNNPELDPRPADFVSTGDGSANEYVPEDENAEQPDPEAPTNDGSGPEQQSLFSASGDFDVIRQEPVPDGSTEDVKNWVGDDTDKAQRALDAEKAGKNRSGLISYLEKVVASK